MSQNAIKSYRSVDNGVNEPEEEAEVRSHSPFTGEVEEEDVDDDRQALLSSTAVTQRPTDPSFRANGAHRRTKSTTQVGNVRYMKEILVETMPTLLFGLLGTFLTGELLELLATWKAFKQIDELLILVPMLLNLKGNLEMNLSARLSTAANMGDLDNRNIRKQLILGNLTLLQVQGILVSCIAAALSFIIGLLLPDPEPAKDPAGLAAYALLGLVARGRPPHHPPSQKPSLNTSGSREFLIVLLIAQTAASFSSLILGSFMCSLVLLCRYFNLNPDNIAPAVASALGDLLTLSLLGISSHFLFPMSVGGLIAVQIGYLTVFLVSFYLTRRNPRIKGLLKEGWSPLLGAMVISSGTGMILDTFVARYKDYAMVSIAQDGIPGSVGSVYISRLSTALHESQGHEGHERGDGHDHHGEVGGGFFSRRLFKPRDEATGKAIVESRPRTSALALFIATVPVQILFLLVSYITRWIDLPALWACGFVIFFGLAVVAALGLSHYLTIFLWNRDYDPDTYALPLQSAFCDLIGQTLLVCCYELAGLIGGREGLESRALSRHVRH